MTDDWIFCELCGMWLNGRSAYEHHLTNRKHVAMLEAARRSLRESQQDKVKVPPGTVLLLEQSALMADIACCLAVRRFVYGRIASRL